MPFRDKILPTSDVPADGVAYTSISDECDYKPAEIGDEAPLVLQHYPWEEGHLDTLSDSHAKGLFPVDGVDLESLSSTGLLVPWSTHHEVSTVQLLLKTLPSLVSVVSSDETQSQYRTHD